MTARDYIEAVALELGKLRGRGLVLSPADAQLALAWHAADIPLSDVLGEIRRGSRLRARGTAANVRGAVELPISLQALAPAIDARRRARPVRAPAPDSLAAELRKAARVPRLPGRPAWEALADTAEELLAAPGGDRYWTAAISALRLSLRELGQQAARTAGAALRERLGPRPAGMPRRRYQRSLQLQLLSAASERLGVPPRAFLL